MQNVISRIWNDELVHINTLHKTIVILLIVIGGVIYVAGEVLFGLNPLAGGFSINDLTLESFDLNQLSGEIESWFPVVWFALALMCFVFRVAVISHSYVKSKKVLGGSNFDKYLLTYFTSFALAVFLSFGLMSLLYGLAKLTGFEPKSGLNILNDAVDWLRALVNAYVPTLLNVNSYWLALLLTLFLSALPGYFVHWLGHKSRLFWYVFHRPHHCPQFLHPMGAPPAFTFDFFLVIPSGLMAIAISKLIYTEPFVMEMGLWFTFAYAFEIFNHSIVHYDFAYGNFFVRNMSRLIGDRGVYHLMHHSAKPSDQTINLGASPFLFWDRLFGTYKKPYEEAPPLGLTNQPNMRMNPARIILSGIAQLWYEFKENKNWKTRLLVLFGPIHYLPPKTKEYLILEY